MADMAEQTAQSQAFAAALSTVAAHPLTQQQLDDNQSDMSSALTDPTNYADLWELADKILDFYNPTSSSDKTCTVIRAFRQILSKHGQVALMADIKTIGRDQSKLRLFARHLINTILKPMKLAGGIQFHTLISLSPHPDAAASIAQSAASITSSNINQQEILKKDCLKRDGYCCAYTHVFDRDSAIEHLVVPPTGGTVSPTQLSHILPLALSKFDDAKQHEREAVAVIWFSLYRYFPAFNGKIGPGTLNQHQNLITFQISVHDNYYKYLLAFNPLNERPNQYEIKSFLPWPSFAQPPQGHQQIMTLVSMAPNIPLPDPEFFRTHYQISKILDEFAVQDVQI